jgi:phosphoglycolate phosphatase
MPKKLVIFDVDGTVVNSSAVLLNAFDAAFRQTGLPLPDQKRLLSVVGLAHAQMFSELLGGKGPIDEMVRTYKATTRGVRANGTAYEPLYPGAAETLQKLEREPSVSLGLATGKSRAGLDRFLSKQGWANMFATTKSSDDGPSKPNPAILFAAMREANVGSDSCVMVGDSVFDMKMARAAGVGAVGVAWGYSSPDLLFAAGASSVATSFSELLVNLGYAEGR